jgi:hypothetical protein
MKETIRGYIHQNNQTKRLKLINAKKCNAEQNQETQKTESTFA